MNTQRVTSDRTREICGVGTPGAYKPKMAEVLGTPVDQVLPADHPIWSNEPKPVEELPEDLSPRENGEAVKIAPPVMMDDNDDAPATEAKEKEVAQAFEVQLFFWRDKALAPFAIGREGAWMQHREMLEEPTLGDVVRKSPAMVPDALRVLWFLSHKPREWLMMPGSVQEKDGSWRRLTSKERAIALEERIQEWGAQNVTSSERVDLVALFYEIYMSAHSTRATAKPSERKDDERSKN